MLMDPNTSTYLVVFGECPGQSNRQLVKRDQRETDTPGEYEEFIILSAHLGNGAVIEYETIERWAEGSPNYQQIGSRTVVREMWNTAVRLPLHMMQLGIEDRVVYATLGVLGYTVDETAKSGTRDHWTRFHITDPDSLTAFRDLDPTGRKPNDEGNMYLVLKDPDGRALVPDFDMMVNGREIKFSGSTEITLVYGPDVDGQCGLLLSAFVRRGTWRLIGASAAEV